MTELEQILQHIENGNNFLLSGGAGSGKTYSLVEVIREVITIHPAEKICCITYTNTAVKEIDERVNHENLKVSTIHDFLWNNIKHFQKELKSSLITLANNSDSKIKINYTQETIPDDFFNEIEKIQYKEFLKIQEGIISHDELIILAEYMFKEYTKLCHILKDKYKFIFVDEYQDTHKEVVDILLKHIQVSNKKNIIGFFGDAMQSIYDSGVDNIEKYISDGLLQEVIKKQNRRNPKLVISLANNLRTDSVIQEPSNDTNAPNMINGKIKDGNIKFIYSDNNDLKKIKEYLSENDGWDFKDSKNTKELNLTHNLIANKAGFENLMKIYNGDQILKFRDRIKKYIKDNNIKDDFSDKTFGEVVDFLQHDKTGRELNAVSPTKTMRTFISENEQLFLEAKQYNYSEFTKIYLDKEQFLDDKKQTEDDYEKKGSKRDSLIKHLFKIQSSISLYESKKYNDFLKITDYEINSTKDKMKLKRNIDSLVQVDEKTIEDIINEADIYKICLKDDSLERFMEEKKYVFNQVKKIKYTEFKKLFEYLQGNTPFTTQHKTKGDEFDNVLVILDNGKWTQYNFENLFLENGNENVLTRTKKLFYVCCTRAKENLAVFYYSPNNEVISKAKDWFGLRNVIEV